MRVEVVTPAAAVISWEEAKLALSFDDDSRQTAVEDIIDGAVASLSGPGGTLGRSIGRQTLRASFSGFGAGSIRLPYGPVDEITTLETRDPVTGAWSTVDAATYEQEGDWLRLAFRKVWPSLPSWSESVRVTYVAGGAALDPAIRSAILLMVRDEIDGTPEASAKSIERLLSGKQVLFA